MHTVRDMHTGPLRTEATLGGAVQLPLCCDTDQRVSQHARDAESSKYASFTLSFPRDELHGACSRHTLHQDEISRGRYSQSLLQVALSDGLMNI